MPSKGILSHYSPEDVTVSIAGLVNIEGYTEGTFVNISRDTSVFQTVESADGRVTRIRKPSKTYTVDVTLMSTAESNALLTRLSILDHNIYVAKFPLMIKDNLGSTLFFSASAWVEQIPSTAFSTTVTERKWQFKCTQAALHVGGNENRSGALEDILNSFVGLAPSIRGLL